MASPGARSPQAYQPAGPIVKALSAPTHLRAQGDNEPTLVRGNTSSIVGVGALVGLGLLGQPGLELFGSLHLEEPLHPVVAEPA